MKISKELMEILACPACHAEVREEGDFVCCLGNGCGLRFPIRNGIPVMLLDEALKKES